MEEPKVTGIILPDLDSNKPSIEVFDPIRKTIMRRVQRFLDTATENEKEIAHEYSIFFAANGYVPFIPKIAGVLLGLGVLEYNENLVAEAVIAYMEDRIPEFIRWEY